MQSLTSAFHKTVTLCHPETKNPKDFNIRIKDHTIGTRKGFVAPSDDVDKIGDIFKEYKNIENLITKMKTLHEANIDRLHIYQNRDTEKTFIDEKGQKRPASEALMPDEKILNFINDFCFHVSNKFTPKAVKFLQDKMKNDPDFNKMVNELHELHVNAYEFFENKMLYRVFSLNIDTLKGFPLMKMKKDIYKQAGLNPEEINKIQETLNPNRALTPKESEDIIQKKISILQVLSYDYHFRKAANLSPQDTISNLYESQMVENYDGVIKPEVELLRNVLGENLSKTNLTFVGAGFPLSAVLQNIRTGIKVTLVDLRKEACENGSKLLNILDILGVIKADDFKIIHRNAIDLTYHKPTEEHPAGTFIDHKDDTGSSNYSIDSSESNNTSIDSDSSHNSLNNQKAKIFTDVLQLAAALPKEVVTQAMTEEKSDIDLVLIRESTLMRLYQPVNDPEYGSFKAQDQAATQNRIDTGLIIHNTPCTVVNQDQDSRTNTILYKREHS